MQRGTRLIKHRGLGLDKGWAGWMTVTGFVNSESGRAHAYGSWCALGTDLLQVVSDQVGYFLGASDGASGPFAANALRVQGEK
eukprot:9481832-Pyramimonas_sp.AAC.1